MKTSICRKEHDAQRMQWNEGLVLFGQGRLREARASWECLLQRTETPKLIYALGELCLVQYDMTAATAYFGRYLRCLAASDRAEAAPAIGLSLSAA